MRKTGDVHGKHRFGKLRSRTGKARTALSMGCALAFFLTICPRLTTAQEANPSAKPATLWTDPETGQLFTKPGPGRVPYGPTAQPAPLAQPQAAPAQAQPVTSPTGLWTDPATDQVFTKPGPGRVPYVAEAQPPQPATLESQERQISKLEDQVSQLTSGKGLQYGPVNIKPGGFIEMATIVRTKNENSDVGSDYNQGIPFNNSSLAHENETRFSARQSRLSMLVSADVNPQTHLGAYFESDFLSSGTNSNSRESNSYTPRLRQAYATVDKDDWGFHFLGGQAWSLMTTNTLGIMPRHEQIPLTIDAQYVEGFNWLRVAQLRAVEDFGHGWWAGVSAEDPQTVTSPITAPSNVNWSNSGDSAGLLNNSTSYSTNYIPDFNGKVAADPGWGHYELKGTLRFFNAHTSGDGTNLTTGWGVGGAATMPIIPQYFELQLSCLAGHGIGRYGSGQLPDAAFNSDNKTLTSIPVAQGLVGMIGHPWKGNDIYLYGGWEHADHTGTTALLFDSSGKFVGASGYGSPKLNVSGCDIEGGTCQAQTEDLQEVTGGFWQDLYKGDFGRFAIGFQAEWIWRLGFPGMGGTPKTNIGAFFTSIRYYPFT
jgi:hypothetical protein